jgi:hypothetical protein
MKRRYSIWVREIASDRDVELMQVDSNPEAIAAQLGQKVLTIKKGIFDAGKRKSKVGKYSRIWIVDNHLGR